MQASVLSGAEVEGPTESSGQPREAFATPAARAAVLKSLPADLGPSVTAADKAVNGTDLPVSHSSIHHKLASSRLFSGYRHCLLSM